jgi:superfamily II DNA or RNA helicase
MKLENEFNNLLDFSLAMFAKRIGLPIEREIELRVEDAAKLLNYAESLSRRARTSEDRQLCIVICGLLHEHAKVEWQAVNAYVAEILIRLGLNPTARMIHGAGSFNNFRSLGNAFSDLQAYLNVEQHKVNVLGHELVLSGFQKRVWDAITEHRFVGISAPTSAGKSYILVGKIVEELSRGDGQVAFVVPTISLMNQVTRDLKESLTKYNLSDVRVLRSVSERVSRDNKKTVYVLTQERALAALGQDPQRSIFDNLRLLVVDEVQNIERVSNESNERSMILMEVIQEFLSSVKPAKVIFSGPRVSNIRDLVRTWAGEDGFCEVDDLPAVINVTYSFRKIKRSKKVRFSQYIAGAPTRHVDIVDDHSLGTKILRKREYKSDAHRFIQHILGHLEDEGGTIVFSKSSAQATATASALAALRTKSRTNLKLLSLKEYAAETVHPQYALCDVVSKGVVYHHGKMPHHIRHAVEKVFKSGDAKSLVCTSTLMQGVNLPAKNIIIRNPAVGTESLSGYEFANLRGRAGRLMKDFVGRAIVIDDEAFEQEQISLDASVSKDLDYNFRSKFENYRQEILGLLMTSNTVKASSNISAELVTYIRQMILRFGESAGARLEQVGIRVEPEMLARVASDMRSLEVSREVCHSNPFWDPHDLDRLSGLVKAGRIPKIPASPYEGSFSLYGALNVLRKDFKTYFDKYLQLDHDGALRSACSMAETWARGESLRKVIEPANWLVKSEKDVDKRLATVHDKIAFGMTKLLKPVVQLQDPDNQILSYIETGAFDPRVRALMTLGLARETSIRVANEVRDYSFLSDETLDFSRLQKALAVAQRSSSLSEWDVSQLTDLAL